MLRFLRYGLMVAVMMILSASLCMAAGKRDKQREDKIRFDGFSHITHLSSSGMNLWIRVDNDSCHKIVVKNAMIEFCVDGTHRATIELRDKIVVPRRGYTTMLVPLRFKVRSLFSLATLLGNIAMGDTEGITVTYKVRAGLPWIKFTFKEKDISVNELLDDLEIPYGEVAILKELING